MGCRDFDLSSQSNLNAVAFLRQLAAGQGAKFAKIQGSIHYVIEGITDMKRHSGKNDIISTATKALNFCSVVLFWISCRNRSATTFIFTKCTGVLKRVL